MRDIFLHYIANRHIPADALFSQKAQLETIASKYPYCQPAQMMFAKSLSLDDPALYHKQVKLAMAAAPDKQWFKKYLSGEVPLPEPPPNAREADNVKTDKGDEIDRVNQPNKTKSTKEQEIIDRFLKKNPRIEVNREAVPVEDRELEKDRLEHHPDLASETLAKILEKQGKKAAAADVYKKLSLKFPEKSSYFAKKFEQLQNETNK